MDIDQDVACSYVSLTCGQIHRVSFLEAFKMDFFFLKLQNVPSQIVSVPQHWEADQD